VLVRLAVGCCWKVVGLGADVPVHRYTDKRNFIENYENYKAKDLKPIKLEEVIFVVIGLGWTPSGLIWHKKGAARQSRQDCGLKLVELKGSTSWME
jgi:hypothetical protein